MSGESMTLPSPSPSVAISDLPAPMSTAITMRETTYMNAHPAHINARSSTVRRLTLRVALAVVAVLAMAVSPAFAAQSRVEVGSFGSDGTSATTFSGANQLAFDQAAHRLFVLDTGASTIDGFDASIVGTHTPLGGGFPVSVAATGGAPDVAVDNSGGSSAGNLYFLSETSGLYGFTPAGTARAGNFPVSGFGDPCGSAVDLSGNVWVGDYGTLSVKEFDATGGSVGSVDTSDQGRPCHVAFDANADLYVAMYNGPTWKYTAASGYVTATEVDTDATYALTVDRVSHQLYVAHGDHVSVYDAAGVPLYDFGGDIAAASVGGVAVDQGSNQVYVSDTGNGLVHVFGAPVTVPGATTGAASPVALTTATLNGTVDPGGVAVTDCHFEYIDDAGFQTNGFANATHTPCTPNPGSGSGDVAVSAAISGLTLDTTYHVRLVATNTNATSKGTDQAFTTDTAVRDLATDPAAAVGAVSATLNGTLDPNGAPITDCHFEYTADTDFQANGFTNATHVACNGDPGSGSGDVAVAADVVSLTPETTYHFRLVATNANGTTQGAEQSFATDRPVHGVTTATATSVTNTTVILNGSLSPDGTAVTDCHFSYVAQAEFNLHGFANATSAACAPDPGASATPVDVSAAVAGLTAGTAYRFRLVATNANGTSTGADATFTTPGSPAVETTGSPTRTATTARLDSRVDPRGVSATYHFEYGDQGPCDTHPCTATADHPAGSGDEIELVSQQITGLTPNTTYHYRVIADNGNPDGPAHGNDMTLTTRTTDTPLSHGHYPGPPDSDRAWEQVSTPDTGGNAVTRALAISDNGDRALYAVNGGSPGSAYGALNNVGSNHLFAERTASGWQDRPLYPSRAQAPGNLWTEPIGSSDLSQLFSVNRDITNVGTIDVWHFRPGAPASHVFGAAFAEENITRYIGVSDDGSRLVSVVRGSLDPDHPVAGADQGHLDRNLYDITSGTPHLISLLPDGSVPNCGVDGTSLDVAGDRLSRAQHWVSSDGLHVFFPSNGNVSPCGGSGDLQLFVRDVATQTTRQVGPAGSHFIRSTDSSAFFSTERSLVSRDTGGNDVYRYDLSSGGLSCVTCLSNLHADVEGSGHSQIAVSDDGSHLYFISSQPLLPGAGSEGIYRVDVARGELAYVAQAGIQGQAGDSGTSGNAISPDGSVFVFWSDAPGLNAIDGQQNGGTGQYYRYNDRDRSVVCVSCPADGSPPRGAVDKLGAASQLGPNLTAISDDGDYAFSTPTALVAADQNTAKPADLELAGSDVYEWRDGRLLLITDGLTTSVRAGPVVESVSPSGQDVFFTQHAQLTPDAIDASTHLYDARVGGGFDFPAAAPPCSLEACQGTASPLPNDADPGTPGFNGRGDQAGVAGKVSVSKPRAVTAFSATLRVRVSGPGRVSLAGSGLMAASHKASKASTVAARVSLSALGRRQLIRHGKLVRKVKVSFVPAGGRAVSVTVSLTFKAARQSGGR